MSLLGGCVPSEGGAGVIGWHGVLRCRNLEHGSGTFGESDDEVDMYTDVLIGRIPVQTAAHINNYVGKVLEYETNPPVHLSR